MAKVMVAGEVVSEMLFGYANFRVDVNGGHYDHIRDVFVFDISGPDVPDADDVACDFSVNQNRRGERFHKQEFRAV